MYHIYNPNNIEVFKLPVIYGFNNGGQRNFLHAQLISSDGKDMGSHLCSDEYYMPGDLGCLKDSALHRHEGFMKEYPNGYRMEFVYSNQLTTHYELNKALKLATELQEKSEHASQASISVKVS